MNVVLLKAVPTQECFNFLVIAWSMHKIMRSNSANTSSGSRNDA